jgi:hypothetical protein
MTRFYDPLPFQTSRIVLARRTSAGLFVTLLWATETNTLAVQVDDTQLDRQFELAIEPAVSPIDVFEHPFAYAAWRGVDYPALDLRYAA